MRSSSKLERGNSTSGSPATWAFVLFGLALDIVTVLPVTFRRSLGHGSGTRLGTDAPLVTSLVD